MGKMIEWYLEKTWHNIWWWRIFAIGNAILLVSLFCYVWFKIFPLLDKYAEIYDLMQSLGYI